MRGWVRRRTKRLAPLALVAGLTACAAGQPPAPEVEPEPQFNLRPIAFEQVEGWPADDPRPALAAFRRSCAKLAERSEDSPMGLQPALGDVGDWLKICTAARMDASTPEAAREFFETHFFPYLVLDGDDPEGLFTGYYEPLLRGSRRYGGRYRVPVYRPPDDLVRIDLGRFNPRLQGFSIFGRIADGQFIPYYSRAEIENGALQGRGLELLWVDDPIDKFFLDIQGSGQVVLDDGSVVRIGYAAQNGHPYRAIGRDLVEIGAFTLEEASLQKIRDWLRSNPDDAPIIMARNRSYIFFQEHRDLSAADGPIGALGVSLTPGRSLAVDPRYLPLGVPVWLDTTVPWPEGEAPLRRLMITQDTGGAIKGVVRGDVFWGAGERAEHVAGHMKSPGQYYLLLPKTLIPVG